jgi:hypothetical protein
MTPAFIRNQHDGRFPPKKNIRRRSVIDVNLSAYVVRWKPHTGGAPDLE